MDPARNAAAPQDLSQQVQALEQKVNGAKTDLTNLRREIQGFAQVFHRAVDLLSEQIQALSKDILIQGNPPPDRRPPSPLPAAPQPRPILKRPSQQEQQAGDPKKARVDGGDKNVPPLPPVRKPPAFPPRLPPPELLRRAGTSVFPPELLQRAGASAFPLQSPQAAASASASQTAAANAATETALSSFELACREKALSKTDEVSIPSDIQEGVRLAGNKQYNLAIKKFSEVITSKSDFSLFAYVAKLVVISFSDQLDRFIDGFEDIAIVYSNPFLFFLKGNVHYKREEFDEAFRCYDIATGKVAPPSNFAKTGALHDFSLKNFLKAGTTIEDAVSTIREERNK